MATTRAKKKAKKVREHNAFYKYRRKVINAQKRVTLAQDFNSAEYWVAVANQLSTSTLKFAINIMGEREYAEGVESALNPVAFETLKTVLLERVVELKAE